MAGTNRTGVLYDRQPLWLEAIAGVLSNLDMAVVGSTSSGTRAVELVERHQPDLSIVGLSSASDRAGFETIRVMHDVSPTVRIIALAPEDDPSAVDAAFDAGAVAYVLKSVEPADFAAAVRQAFATSIYFAASPLRRRGQPRALERHAALTRRETEILRLAAEGHSNADLARMLWVTEQTIKFHLSNVYRKLNVSNRTEASRWAQTHGLLTADEAQDRAAAPQASRTA